MRVLLDTNVLVRFAQPSDPKHIAAVAATYALKSQGQSLHISPQNLYELWVVCTRPLGENGLGMTTEQAGRELQQARRYFELVPESPDLYAAWELLVTRFDCKGKTAHDTRLVAAMTLHGLATLLTFNKQHFARFSKITVRTPDEVVRASLQRD